MASGGREEWTWAQCGRRGGEEQVWARHGGREGRSRPRSDVAEEEGRSGLSPGPTWRGRGEARSRLRPDAVWGEGRNRPGLMRRGSRGVGPNPKWWGWRR